MNRGGLETFTMGLMRNIDRNQIQFDYLVSNDGDYDEEILSLGGRIFKIPFISKTGPFRYALNLRRFFHEHPEYQIVHIQMDKFGGMTAREAFRCGLPVRIVHSHSTKNEGGLIRQTVKNYYGGMVVKYATHLIACGEAAAIWMFGEAGSKAIIARNGVDLSRFMPKDDREGPFTLCHVGRFIKTKNHDLLLDVFSEVVKSEPGAKLLLAGDGPLKASIRGKAERLGVLHAVEFLGMRTDVENVFAKADALCMPSLFEGLPVTLVEAQACGIPCLVSDAISAESDLTGDVEFMSLGSPPGEWAKKLLRLEGRPRKDNAASLEAAGYSIRQVASAMQELYLELSAGL